MPRDQATGTPLDSADDRRTGAIKRRASAAEVAFNRPLLVSMSNEEETRFSTAQPTNFTKGLKHDDYGLVSRREYEAFRSALVGFDPMLSGLQIAASAHAKTWRRWESPLAGHYFTLEGPDPDGVAMAPAPKLGRSELCAEMASLYAMALLRDIPFASLANESTEIEGLSFPEGHARNEAGQDPVVRVSDVLAELRKFSWFDPGKTPTGFFGTTLTAHEQRRRAAHWDGGHGVTLASLFRGSTAGAKIGPYISQFMLLGTTAKRDGQAPSDGRIRYGVQTIDQRIDPAVPGRDYMTRWADWLEVQNGADTKGKEEYLCCPRRVTTPRDLATYVHFDQLYQAYLNACLLMLANDVPTDMGNPIVRSRPDTSEGFATWGGPHVLSLVTEVATRALRAVRRQKFLVHRRARPEVLAARLTQAANAMTGHMDPGAVQALDGMLREFGADEPLDANRPGLLLFWIAQHNGKKGVPSPTASDVPSVTIEAGKNYLLPMAFSEGSPMHAAYGAGHATVAGACVTVLKAFFESGMPFKDAIDGADSLYQANPKAKADDLVAWLDGGDPTLAHELDKLAANISIGRNMAGVHYYSDYYDSLRMGERVAVGILEEQMLTYGEPVSLQFTSFDGEEITLRTDGGSSPGAVSFSLNGKTGKDVRNSWWVKDVVDYGIVV